MAKFLIIPTVAWKSYSALTANTAVSGTIYNSMNSPKDDYVTVASTQTLDFTHSAALTFPLSVASCPAAFWTKWGDAILTDTSPDNYYMRLQTGASFGAVATKTLVTVYGDATAATNDVSINGGMTKTDGYSHVIGVFDDQYSDICWRIQLLNYGTPTYTDFKLYEVIIGHKVSLPDGTVREERAIQRVHYGGRVGVKKFGDANWSGIYGQNPRKSFELVMEGLNETQRNTFRDVFRYCRGTYPVLVVEDSSDKTTWTKCKMVRRTEEEDAKMFTVAIEFDEI